MSWAKIDDQLPHHRKLMQLGARAPTAYGWYVASINFCRRHLTDGRVTRADFPLLIPACPRVPKSVIADLERAGFWDREADGWRVHDFLDHNDPATEVKARLAKDAARKRTVRGWVVTERRPVGVPPESPTDSDGSPAGVQRESTRSPLASIAFASAIEKESPSPVAGDAHRIEGRTEQREAFQKLVAEVSQRVGFQP